MARKDGSAKLKDLDDRMHKLRIEAGLAEPDRKAAPRVFVGGAGLQVGIELVAGVIGGALIGYGLDRWLETWPILFLVFFFLGAAAGMLNAYRYIRRISDVPEDERRAARGRSKDG